MALLDDVKKSLRRTDNEFDDEILEIIEAGKEDLITSGVNEALFTDEAKIPPLVLRALKSYCNMEFYKMDNPDYPKMLDIYKRQVNKLNMSSGYKEIRVSEVISNEMG